MGVQNFCSARHLEIVHLNDSSFGLLIVTEKFLIQNYETGLGIFINEHSCQYL